MDEYTKQKPTVVIHQITVIAMAAMVIVLVAWALTSATMCATNVDLRASTKMISESNQETNAKLLDVIKRQNDMIEAATKTLDTSIGVIKSVSHIDYFLSEAKEMGRVMDTLKADTQPNPVPVIPPQYGIGGPDCPPSERK